MSEAIPFDRDQVDKLDDLSERPILLPGALIAGVMGMNFKVGLFEEPMLFWAVLAVIVLIASATIALAKLWRWI